MTAAARQLKADARICFSTLGAIPLSLYCFGFSISVIEVGPTLMILFKFMLCFEIHDHALTYIVETLITCSLYRLIRGQQVSSEPFR